MLSRIPSSVLCTCSLRVYAKSHKPFEMWKTIAPFILGLGVHLCVFIRNEWHRSIPAVVLAHFSFFVLISANETRHTESLSPAVQAVTLYFVLYIFGLFLSIAVYRIRYHPLQAFPGPVLARLSKFWHVYQCRSSQNHLLLESLRKEYGEIVRTGKISLLTLEYPLTRSYD